MGRLRLRLSEICQANGNSVFKHPPLFCPPYHVHIGQLVLPSTPHFLWVTEFPLLTHDADKEFQAHGRWSSSHHPFTAPMVEDIPALLDGRYEQVRGQHYDLVLNGMEIGGGSVRIHDAALQEHIFSEVLQVRRWPFTLSISH